MTECKICTFRGLIASGTQDRINLHTNDGKIGYRIVKFQLFPRNFNISEEYNLAIWSDSQGTFTAASPYALTTFDFSDNTLLAAGFIETVGGSSEGLNEIVVFDNETFNQDIFVTHVSQAAAACNYYIELEQISLDLNEATVATLQSIRNA
jgi:hypothetical protein